MYPRPDTDTPQHAASVVAEMVEGARAHGHGAREVTLAFPPPPTTLAGDIEASPRAGGIDLAPPPVAAEVIPAPEATPEQPQPAAHGLHQLEELPLWRLPAAVLRERLLHAAHPAEPRSTHERVFLMLAFAVMVLLVSPPIVRIIDAIHGG